MEAKIKYTESGLKELDNYMKDHQKKVEELLLNEKYIMGDDIIEVTGADIIKLKQRLNISYKNNLSSKSSMLKLTAYIYTILGIGLTIFGFSYEYLLDLLKSNKEQAMFIIMGITITLFGISVSVFIRFKEKRQIEIREIRKIEEEFTGHNIV